MKPDNASQLPLRIEHAMLEILTRPRSSVFADTTQREPELRALFTVLDPDQAHDLVRRFGAGRDPLALELRSFVRRRRK